jgi:hypothetical protein
MIETIQPREYFPIVRILKDHTDSSTNYVRAVIRNAKTNVLIETLNLTDQTGHIFSYNWQAIADPSGQGLFISITTTVYTDSGYTTKNDNYGEEIDTILIYDRTKYSQILGNQIGANIGDSVEVDYKKIRKIVQEEIGKIEIPKVSLTEVQSSIKGLATLIEKVLLNSDKGFKDIVTAFPKPIDQQLKDILGAIKAIEIPDQEKTDLSSLENGLKKLSEDLSKIIQSGKDEVIAESSISFKETLNDWKEEFLTKFEKLITNEIRDINFDVSLKPNSIEKKSSKSEFIVKNGHVVRQKM